MSTPEDPDDDEFDYHFDNEDDYEGWCDTCHNTGMIDCHCGGDLCVCRNNGELPCPHCDRGF